MIALIDPRYGRVCQIEPEERRFEVAAPLFWAPVPEGLPVTTQWSWRQDSFTPPAEGRPEPDRLATLRVRVAAVPAGAVRDALNEILKLL